MMKFDSVCEMFRGIKPLYRFNPACYYRINDLYYGGLFRGFFAVLENNIKSNVLELYVVFFFSEFSTQHQ